MFGGGSGKDVKASVKKMLSEGKTRIEAINALIDSGISENVAIQTVAEARHELGGQGAAVEEMPVKETVKKPAEFIVEHEERQAARPAMPAVALGSEFSSRDEVRRFMKEEAENIAAEMRQRISTEVKEDLLAYKLRLTSKEQEFKDAINKNVSSMAELSENVRKRLNELSQDLKTVKLDVAEARLTGTRVKNKFISVAMLVLGGIFLAVDLYLFYTGFGTGMTVDAVIMLVIMAMAGITMMFTASIT